MMDRLMAVFAYLVMAASLIVLVCYVPRWDLGGVIAVTLILAGVDVVQLLRRDRRKGR